jgi:hypothetical protein
VPGRALARLILPPLGLMQIGKDHPVCAGKADPPGPAPAPLLANHEPWRPVKPPMAVMYLQERVRTKLEEMAAILKSEIAHDTFEFIQIIETDARRALSSNARCFVFRHRFHNDFHTQGIGFTQGRAAGRFHPAHHGGGFGRFRRCILRTSSK